MAAAENASVAPSKQEVQQSLIVEKNATAKPQKQAVQQPLVTEKKISISEAIRSALNYNLKLFISRSEEQRAKEEHKRSGLAFFPDVKAHLSTSVSKDNDHVWHGNMSNDSELRPHGTEVGVTIRQNIFSGFTNVNSMKAADFAAQAQKQKLKYDEQELIREVIEAYLNIWCSRQKVDAYKKREENIYKFYMARKSSYEVGTGTQVEIAEANSKYQRAVSDRINAETEQITAESQFVYLTGMSAIGKIDLPVLDAQLPNDLDAVIAIAKAFSPRILHSKLQEEAALKKLSATKGLLAPSCDLTLSANRSIQKYRNDDRDGDRYQKHLQASLSVTVPIFANDNGNNTYSAIEIANQEALKSRFEAKNVITHVINECVVNWRTHISADARIQSNQAAVDSANKSSQANLEEEALGLKSNTEVWANENTLLEAKADLYKAQTEKILAYAKLQEMMGRLSLETIGNSLKSTADGKVPTVAVAVKSDAGNKVHAEAVGTKPPHPELQKNNR
jgi:outer membrane protein TolC